MSLTLILPEQSELKAVQENLESLKDVHIISIEDRLDKITKKTYIDLSLDIFNRIFTSGSLYRIFEHLEVFLSRLESSGSEIFLIRSYPFRTNVKHFLVLQKIIDDYSSTLTEFFDIRQIFLPTVISRHCYQGSCSPPGKIINALRMDHTETIKLKRNSRFFVIYDRDVIEFLLRPDEDKKKHIIIEGIEMSLEEIYEKTKPISGETPIQFDSQNFLNYEYPISPAESYQSINYSFEDMLIDITSNLF